MILIHNGAQYAIKEDPNLSRKLSLKVALSSSNAPEKWVNGDAEYDSGMDFYLSISQNLLEKYCLETTPIDEVKIHLAAGRDRRTDVVLLNIIIKGVSSGDVTVLSVPTLVTENDNQLLLGQKLFHFFRISSTESRVELLALNDKAIK